jgi:hypothetical protein
MSLPSLLVFYRRHEIIIFHAFDQMQYRILDYCTVLYKLHQSTVLYCTEYFIFDIEVYCSVSSAARRC